jgi:protein-S-isoprenylcysteine O-methyltransferase Ste14
MAWAFLLVYVIFAVVALLALSRPLIEERSKLLAQGQRTDVLLASAFAVFLYPGTMLVCGFDHRFAWSPPVPGTLEVVALALFVVGYAFSLWAMRANPFFATVVRIQGERGHQVVDQGPYRLVRHPGYAGAVAAHLVLPVALGSLWGLLPAVIGSVLLAFRVVHEERVLERDLAGYREYKSRVQWRLVPGVW